MSRPVIGITCYLEPARWGAWDTRAVLLHEEYTVTLSAAGATGVLLPPGADADVLDRLDGLVLAGGADIGPATYGAAADPTTDTPRADRDSGELALYAGARERDLPVLGICRGLQLIAVAAGGTLHQDIPTLGLGVSHRDAPGTFTEHTASFAPHSLLARTLGVTSAVVNSSHHQAVATAGSLTVTGWAQDGTIEACEDPSARFVLGVQWHPEMAGDAVAKALFGGFTDACRDTTRIN